MDDFEAYEECVDFDDYDDTEFLPAEPLKDPHLIEYDDATKNKYCILRKMQYDPIGKFKVNENTCFRFAYKWDPYTGSRGEIDKDGPLCFDPDYLIKQFHTSRLYKLWVPEKQDETGYYQGYYDDAVGVGKDFNVNGKIYPEWYIFRLPISDCYIPQGANMQLITYGPILTRDDIVEIDRLANLDKSAYQETFHCTRPSLVKLYDLYHQAISQTPDLSKVPKNNNDLFAQKLCANRLAVDKLRNISG